MTSSLYVKQPQPYVVLKSMPTDHENSSESDSDNSPYYTDVEKTATCPPFCLPSLSHTSEHFRDISFLGPITLHRLFVLLWIGAVMMALYYVQVNFLLLDAIFGERTGPIWEPYHYLFMLSLIAFPTMFISVLGNFWFSYSTGLDDVQPISYNVAFRIVSRGTNNEVLTETIRRCQLEMSRNPMFPYLIEVVTDTHAFEAPLDEDVIHLLVPKCYRTPNRTKFKVRALNYACQNSIVPSDTWIIHLDEETQPTSSGIKGIAQFIAERERTNDIKRIGQGCITYHRAIEEHPFLTLCDMRRTGDDLGHYYFQHRLGFTLFGLHGSYVVCRQDMEAAIGFDLGPAGSITEDAWWVLLAMQKGYRTCWVDGYLEEQSTQSIMDFLKQRTRWLYGLVQVVRHCPVKLKYRFVIAFHTISWYIIPLLIPMQLAYIIVLRGETISVVHFVTNFLVGVTTLVYMSGLMCNMVEHRVKWWHAPFWMFAMIICLPFCSLLEMLALSMSLFAECTPDGKGFHVVQKSGHQRLSLQK